MVLGRAVFDATWVRLRLETDPNFERCLNSEMNLLRGGIGMGLSKWIAVALKQVLKSFGIPAVKI